jgi:hypothetical protein
MYDDDKNIKYVLLKLNSSVAILSISGRVQKIMRLEHQQTLFRGTLAVGENVYFGEYPLFSDVM